MERKVTIFDRRIRPGGEKSVRLHELPEQVKNDIENKSLHALREIKGHIVVIGGWAARAHGGSKHIRYTFDINGVADKRGLKRTQRTLEGSGFSVIDENWGFRATIPHETQEELDVGRKDLKIKVEISEPRIYEIDGSHYFEFDLEETEEKEVVSMDESTRVDIRVPNIDYLVANKLGLPPLFKNMYDGCLLILKSDVDEVSNLIKGINDWNELAQTRISKTLEALKNRGSILNRELSKTGEISEMRRRVEQVLNNFEQ